MWLARFEGISPNLLARSSGSVEAGISQRVDSARSMGAAYLRVLLDGNIDL
jgi:hypothetical protein